LIADGLGVTRIAFHSGYAILAGLGLLVLALIVIQSLQAPSRVLSPPTQTSILPTSATPKASSGEALVGQASVIDGDTIDIHGTRIRFNGIDAPESGQTCEVGGTSYRCGQKAALALSDFIGNHAVSCNKTGTDRYRRVIAKCFADGIDLSSWMVLNGWAIAYRKYSMDYVADEDRARNQKVGIWAGRGTIDIAKRAHELGVDVGALKSTLDILSNTTREVSESGNSVTVSHTQTTKIGRTEIKMGNTEEAKSGKLSKTQTGEKVWNPYYVFGGIVALVLIAFLFAGRH